MAKDFKEKEITVNFNKVFDKPVTKRATSSLKVIRDKVTKETRLNDVKLKNSVNEAVWQKGLFKGLRKLKVKVVKDKNTAVVYLPEDKVEVKEKKKETKKAVTKPETDKKEEKKEEPEKDTKKEEKASEKKDDKK
jgi:large subunit ribosomal protein L31e